MSFRSLLLVLACLQSFTMAQKGNVPDECCFSFQTRPIPVRVITDYEETDLQCTKPGVIFTLQNGRPVCADTGIKWVKDHMNRIDQRLFNSLNNTDAVVGPGQCCTKFVTQSIPVRVIKDFKTTAIWCSNPGVIFTLQNGLRVCSDPRDNLQPVAFSLPAVDGPDLCCFSFLTRQIPERVITAYEKTHPQCLKPAVIFTLQNGRHVCSDPQVEWVKDHMKKLYQRPFSSLTNTEDGDGLDHCCFRFQRGPISVRVITDYKETDPKCSKPGVIFTLQDGRHVCADPKDKWVKNHMNRIDQRLFNSLNKPESGSGPDQCCFRFLTGPIPVRVITDYEVTDIQCAKPGVIFTLQNDLHVCADPQDKWVKYNMNKLDQRLFNSLNNTEDVDGPDQCCTKFVTQIHSSL